MTALPAYGGIRLPFAIGAVVDGVPTTCQTPLSGQSVPVDAVVPIGAFDMIYFPFILTFWLSTFKFKKPLTILRSFLPNKGSQLEVVRDVRGSAITLAGVHFLLHFHLYILSRPSQTAMQSIRLGAVFSSSHQIPPLESPLRNTLISMGLTS